MSKKGAFSRKGNLRFRRMEKEIVESRKGYHLFAPRRVDFKTIIINLDNGVSIYSKKAAIANRDAFVLKNDKYVRTRTKGPSHQMTNARAFKSAFETQSLQP